MQANTPTAPIALRPATLADATALSALSIQVFLDTYATQGVDTALAREALIDHSEQALAQRLQDPSLITTVAHHAAGALLGFVQTDVAASAAPVGSQVGCEVRRLYVQPCVQRTGLGARLLQWAEGFAAGQGAPAVWLTAWADNTRARAFYARHGYADVGSSVYRYEAQVFENRVLVKLLGRPARPAPALPETSPAAPG